MQKHFAGGPDRFASIGNLFVPGQIPDLFEFKENFDRKEVNFQFSR